MDNNYYLSLVEFAGIGFMNIGYADGYDGLPSKHKFILDTIYKSVSSEDLAYYIDLYLQGYELGTTMSYNDSEMYDENLNIDEDTVLDNKEISANNLVLSKNHKKY